ncbi:MAG: diacylglycerol kinase family lipid kinase [Xanthomonadaceae bacterium]|nr:diacylglycerol kinase family lipid kinase [Xanthomonadaceae bacterium]
MASIPVLVNARSGPKGAATDCAAIEGAFRTQGLQADVIVLQPDQDIPGAVDKLLADGARLVVAGGGDGTINAVASRLLDKDAVLGVLPLGTLNHFARDLGIPFEVDQAVAIVAANHVVSVDVGEVNDRVFLNNSSLGLYPRIVTGREHAQKRLGVGKWPAMAHATWRALRHPAIFNAVICVDGRELQRRTPFIFVGNNDYVMEGFGLGKRTRLDAGLLSLYVLRPKTAWGLLSLGFRALFGIGSHAGDFDAFQAADFRVEEHAGEVEVATDGEVNAVQSPMRYRIRPKALRVLAPDAPTVPAGAG